MDETMTALALRESEELHRITLMNMSDAVFITNDDGLFTFICPNVDVIFGFNPDEVRAMDRISQLLGRELVDRGQLAEHGEIRNIEHEVLTKRGERRRVLVHIKQVSIKGGTTLYVCRDVTDRHRLEDELRELSGRLIHAHEQERIRIARELHDDVAQRLSLLAVELSSLARGSPTLPSGVAERISELAAHAASVGSDLHRVSHELHPATLQQLGLETAIRAFCRELSKAHEIAIDVDVTNVQHPLPPDVALCLYRITQAALHNVTRHSQAASAVVTLRGTADELALIVTDTGIGFDVRAPRNRASLGLRSMLERLWLVNGQLSVHSKPGEGTRIEARVPMQSAG